MYPAPPNRTQRAAAAQSATRARARLLEDILRLCEDAGLAPEQLARAAGVSGSYLRRVIAGTAKASIETYAKLAGPLGADLAARMYPNTGPVIRDRHQARIFEALLVLLGSMWRPHAEATVWKPVRGAIDAVLQSLREPVVIATEIESDMRRIEQTIRWSREKAEALASWSGWPSVAGAVAGSGAGSVAGSVASVAGAPPSAGSHTGGGGGALSVSQLLIVRRTRANERVAREFAQQLALAYPAHPEDALAALRGEKAWPGSTLVWARIEKDRVQFLLTR